MSWQKQLALTWLILVGFAIGIGVIYGCAVDTDFRRTVLCVLIFAMFLLGAGATGIAISVVTEKK